MSDLDHSISPMPLDEENDAVLPEPIRPRKFNFGSKVPPTYTEVSPSVKESAATATAPPGAYIGIEPTLKLKLITREMQQKVLDSKVVGDEDIRRINSAPQRSQEWHAAREGRLTGSRAGTAIGKNPYESQDDLMRSMLGFTKFAGNAATRNGTKMEPFAAASFLRIMRARYGAGCQLGIPGLIVCKAHPYIAYSADGVVILEDGTRALIEIKAPFRKKVYPMTPPMYFAQMQLGMFVLNLSACYFVVYCGSGGHTDDSNTHIEVIPRDNKYINETLLPGLNKFYFKRFLPMYICLKHNMLKNGQVYLPCGVRVEYLK